jgi:hypothetical protein
LDHLPRGSKKLKEAEQNPNPKRPRTARNPTPLVAKMPVTIADI